MKSLIYTILLFLLTSNVMGQTSTTTKSTFSTSTDFSSSLSKKHYDDVLNYLNKKLGNSDLSKEKSKIWLVQNEKNEIYEISLSNNNIDVIFKSKVVNSSIGKEIEEVINNITGIIHKHE